MTNIYPTDSDEEAIVDFVNDHNELYDKASKHFKDKARCFSGRSSPRFANFLERYERHKSGQEMTEDRTPELDTGQVGIPEVTHQKQGAQQVVSLHITGPRSE